MSALLAIVLLLITTLFFSYGFYKKIDRLVLFRVGSMFSAFSLLLLINLLPIRLGTTAQLVSKRDIIFVVDLTQSMNANDGRAGNDTTRLDDVRTDITTIAKQNVGASIGIVTFSDIATTYLPITTNSNDITNAVDTLFTSSYLNMPTTVVTYSDVFKKLATDTATLKKHDPTRERTVIFMSDFEIFNNSETTENVIDSTKTLTETIGGFVSIAYGKSEGSKILKMTYDYDEDTFMPYFKTSSGSNSTSLDDDFYKYLDGGPDNNYKPIVSKANKELAASIASSLKGQTLTYEQNDEYQTTISKAFSSATSAAAKDPKSQAIRQNWLYAPVAFVIAVWLVVLEILKPIWLDKLLTSKKRGRK